MCIDRRSVNKVEGGDSIYKRMMINDFKRSRLISITTFIFIAIATMLLSLSAILFANLTSSIDDFMERAETPHFMQMHSGKLDRERLGQFALSNQGVDQFQVREFVNVEAGDIIINGNSFDGGIQDTGLVSQGSTFDFLLDMDGNTIEPKAGQIYVPLNYMKDGSIKEGDFLDIYGFKFKVSGFLRDSQMNSPLASSKRFLLSDKDFESIKPYGKMEYLIEFRLKNIEDINAFEAQYVNSGLEANGPTLTYPLFRMINGLSDGLMIAVTLLMSFLVVGIAFLCIRFTLLARLEDEYQEIGVLKAVGLYNRDVIRLYILKYAIISFLGCIGGYLLAMGLKSMMLKEIKLFMGINFKPEYEFLLGLVCALFIFVIILSYVRYILRWVKTVSVTEAIRFGTAQSGSKLYKKFGISSSKLLSSNMIIAIKDILGSKRLYFTMVTVLVIAIFMMTLPLNLYNTISSENFISYMGVGKCDFRLDIQNTTDILQKSDEIEAEMKQDAQIEKFAVLVTRSYRISDAEDLDMRLKIETGDHSVFPINYSKGQSPMMDDEIALSTINSEELGKDIGDNISIFIDGKAVKLTVCGIYSDITNGGKTAKAVFKDSSKEVMWSNVCAELKDSSKLEAVLSNYSTKFKYAKASSIEAYVRLTFGSTIEAMRKAAILGSVSAIGIIFMITFLFVKMMVSKDRHDIAIMKAIGYYNRDIRLQFTIRTLAITIFSICIGTILSITIGEQLAGAMISSFGAEAFSFDINRIFTYLVFPLITLMVVYIATISATKSIEQINITQCVKE